MKIREFSNLFHLKKETIRYYRERKLLRPAQDENGYFDYTIDDLGVLYQILNYRNSHDQSLDCIERLLLDNPAAHAAIISSDQNSLHEIDLKIAKLMRLRSYLESRIHYRESLMREQGVVERISNSPGLFFMPLSSFVQYPEEVDLLCASVSTYQSVVIDLDAFLDPRLTRFRPQYALGFTDTNYEKTGYYSACDLSRYTRIERGHDALRFIVRLPTLREIPREVFAPVYDYAAEHRLRFIAPVTSIILLTVTDPAPCYYVMFRFLVKEEGL